VETSSIRAGGQTNTVERRLRGLTVGQRLGWMVKSGLLGELLHHRNERGRGSRSDDSLREGSNS